MQLKVTRYLYAPFRFSFTSNAFTYIFVRWTLVGWTLLKIKTFEGASLTNLSANFTKWSNTPKQLALKGLKNIFRTIENHAKWYESLLNSLPSRTTTKSQGLTFFLCYNTFQCLKMRLPELYLNQERFIKSKFKCVDWRQWVCVCRQTLSEFERIN